MQPAKPILLFIVLYIIPLSGVGVDLYAPSLPAIAKGLVAPPTLVRSSLAIYLFGFSLGQFVNGTLSDIHGRRIILLFNLATFIIASFLVTIVENIYFLLLMRLIQGLSVAGPSVISKAILTDTLKGAELKKASLYLLMVWGVSPILAPGVGGYLQHYFGWHANFYFFAIYALSMFILVFLLLKETNLNLTEPRWKKVFHAYRTILSNNTFVANVFCMSLSYSTIIIFSIFTPFLVQDVLGYSAITYGHMAMILGTAFLLGTLSNRWLMSQFHTQHVNRFGTMLLILIATTMMIFVHSSTMTLITIIVPVFFIVLTMGALQGNFMVHCLSLFPHMGGSASAVLGGVMCLIAGLISTIGAFIHHSNNQIPVSWIYTIIVGLYVVTYWTILDSKAAH